MTEGSGGFATVGGVRVPVGNWSISQAAAILSDGDLLLAAVIAHPDEDTPRLVYADWLEENGEADRAEFIRVQVELARTDPNTPGSPDHAKNRDPKCPCRYCDLRRREWELTFERHDRGREFLPGVPPEWTAKFDRDTDPSYSPPKAFLGRGFVSRVLATAADWLAHGDEIRRHHPIMQVVLTTRPPHSWAYCDYASPEAVCATAAGKRVEAKSGLDEDVLPARWPGVTFELPTAPAWEDLFADLRTIDVTLAPLFDSGPVLPDPRMFLMPRTE